MFQETHFLTGSYQSCRIRHFMTWYHSTNPEGKTKGVSIAIHKSLQVRLLAQKADPTGRYLFLKLQIAGSIYTAANLYLPNQHQVTAGLTYLKALDDFREGQLIICWDFNIPLPTSRYFHRPLFHQN